MRTSEILIFCFLTAAIVQGCAQLAGVIDSASDKTADAVTAYCENFTVDQRQVFGDQVRDKAAPHVISVTCN